MSYIFIILGIAFMLFGAATALPPFSSIKFGDIEVTEVPTFTAILVFIGIVIFASGVMLYLKGK